MMQLRLLVFSFLFIVLAWTPDAHAYIDPGTGSILVQGLIAAIAAIGVTLKLYWHKVTRLFGRRSGNEHATEDVEKSKHAVRNEKD